MPNIQKAKLRTLSGKDVISIFEKLGFVVNRTKGSHVVLRRMHFGNKQTLIIPKHNKLKTGMLRALYKQALQYVSEDKLREHFYT